jgi:sarcosine oxidase subunit alpha
MDASTLGKIDVQGPDAAEFLNRLYTNAIGSLPVGSIRYSVLCRADGMLFDDGVVMRLAPDHFLATTTTGNAAAVLGWMEEWLQTEWPTLRVWLTSVTDHWATIAVVGPHSRAVLGRVAPDLALDRTAFPFMTWREGAVAGLPARVCRVTFSGELAFEIYVPWWHALEVWEAVMDAGADFGILPYGTETMHVLRAEKGYIIAGQDTDGTVTPHDLGMSWIVSKKKRDFIGRRSLSRSDTSRPDRKQLVGLLPVDPEQELPEGTQLLLEPPADLRKPAPMLGHVTSSYRSAVLGRTFALALLKDGRARHGSRVYAPVGNRLVEATVTDTVFYDPEHTRREA